MHFVDSLQGLAAIGLLLLVLYGPWQWVCTDAARQHAFHLRDQLFDIARSGRLDFASSEYRIIRSAFDHHIRYAHELTWAKLVFFAPVARKLEYGPSRARQSLEHIPDPIVRREVKALMDQLDTTFALMIVGKSIPLVVLAAIAFLGSIGFVRFRKVCSAAGRGIPPRRGFQMGFPQVPIPERLTWLIYKEVQAP